MSADTDLYERDFVAWTEAQAAELRAAGRARNNAPVDWENVAEEIESLGRSDKRQLENRLTTIIEHLLKLKWSAAQDPTRGWRGTVIRERRGVAKLLRESPSLRNVLQESLDEAFAVACDVVADELLERGEITSSEAADLHRQSFEPSQVLDEWWPGRRG